MTNLYLGLGPSRVRCTDASLSALPSWRAHFNICSFLQSSMSSISSPQPSTVLFAVFILPFHLPFAILVAYTVCMYMYTTLTNPINRRVCGRREIRRCSMPCTLTSSPCEASRRSTSAVKSRTQRLAKARGVKISIQPAFTSAFSCKFRAGSNFSSGSSFF